MPTESKAQLETLFLLLEDDDIEASLIQRTLDLGWKAPFQMHRCTRVKECLEFFKLREPDVILLDLNVLDSSGIATVEKVARKKPQSSVLIVATSMRDQSIALKSLELGAQDYVIKGEYSPDSLSSAIKFALARTNYNLPQATVDQGKLSLSDIKVDLMSQSLIIFNGEHSSEFNLTPLEVRLSAFFISNFDKELNREEIKDGVWGKEMSISDRVIDNQVSRLRSKMETSKYQIKSIRGFGYRFTAEK